MAALLVGFAAAALLQLSAGFAVTISNSLPRLDVDGNIVDCHSGNIILVNGTYFMYGERYTNHTGMGKNRPAVGLSGLQKNPPPHSQVRRPRYNFRSSSYIRGATL